MRSGSNGNQASGNEAPREESGLQFQPDSESKSELFGGHACEAKEEECNMTQDAKMMRLQFGEESVQDSRHRGESIGKHYEYDVILDEKEYSGKKDICDVIEKAEVVVREHRGEDEEPNGENRSQENVFVLMQSTMEARVPKFIGNHSEADVSSDPAQVEIKEIIPNVNSNTSTTASSSSSGHIHPVFIASIGRTHGNNGGVVDLTNDLRVQSISRDTTQNNLNRLFSPEGRTETSRIIKEKKGNCVRDESSIIGDFLSSKGTSRKGQRKATKNRSRDMSSSEQRWVLEYRSKVCIERGDIIVRQGDYKGWHEKGLAEKALRGGLGEESIKRLCNKYDAWKRKNSG